MSLIVNEVLLNMSEEELKQYQQNEHEEPYITIGKDRKVTVPDELKRLGVQYDHNIENVNFICPRYWDGEDMYEMNIYINYMRPDGVIGCCIPSARALNKEDDKYMLFSWKISKHVTMVKGSLRFIVCIRQNDDEGNERLHWNSELCTDAYISEGLECDEEAIKESYPDIFDQLLNARDETKKLVDEAAKYAEKAKGERGSEWYTGTAMTGTYTTPTIFHKSGIYGALINDHYLNPETGNVYKCVKDGDPLVAEWKYVGNIKACEVVNVVLNRPKSYKDGGSVSFDLRDVVYGNGMFVAVGDGVCTSTDGKTWAEVSSMSSANLYGIAYGTVGSEEEFVAVGTNGVYISTDGENWTFYDSVGVFNIIAYGDGTFVMAGSSGLCRYNHNGFYVNSDTSSDTFYNNAKSIAYGNGAFVIVGRGIRVSDSNLTVKTVSQYSDSNLASVVYSNNRFLSFEPIPSIGDADNDFSNIIISDDNGNTWKDTEKDTNTPSDIVYGHGTLLGVDTQGLVEFSTDGGLKWATFQKHNKSSVSAAYGNNMFVVVGSGGVTGYVELERQTTLLSNVVAEVFEDFTGGVRTIEAVNDFFKDVSDGKKLIASAITDKGVETSGDASFNQMASNILMIDTYDYSEEKALIAEAITNKGVATSADDSLTKMAENIEKITSINKATNVFTCTMASAYSLRIRSKIKLSEDLNAIAYRGSNATVDTSLITCSGVTIKDISRINDYEFSITGTVNLQYATSFTIETGKAGYSVREEYYGRGFFFDDDLYSESAVSKGSGYGNYDTGETRSINNVLLFYEITDDYLMVKVDSDLSDIKRLSASLMSLTVNGSSKEITAVSYPYSDKHNYSVIKIESNFSNVVTGDKIVIKTDKGFLNMSQDINVSSTNTMYAVRAASQESTTQNKAATVSMATIADNSSTYTVKKGQTVDV